MKKPKSPIDAFIALPDSEKNRIYHELDAATPEEHLHQSRPLTSAERRRWQRFKTRMGRPKIGAGARTISLTVEKQLLNKADAYAKQHGLSRAKLVAQGLRAILDSAAK